MVTAVHLPRQRAIVDSIDGIYIAGASAEPAGGAQQSDLFGDRGALPVTPTKAPVAVLAVVTPPSLLDEAAAALAPRIFLGTSSWSFPGWAGLLYRERYRHAQLAHDGLRAYACSPLLRAVGIDRSFYAPLSADEYAAYATQVSANFRFVVKAPARVCDAATRVAGGLPSGLNADFLNATIAIDTFVRPCLEGLGHYAGALVFQLSPIPEAMLAAPERLLERLARFFDALPPLAAPTVYALELRDARLLTPRLIKLLAERGVRYCLGVHARMPDVVRQARALALLDSLAIGPLIVRWSLHAGLRYDGAKARYEPFDAIVDADLPTRHALAELIAHTIGAGQEALVIVNNKAEGSSPLSCAWLALAVADALRRTG